MSRITLDSGLLARLAVRLRGETVIVGIGNPYRGDDTAGCLVAQALAPSGTVRVVHAEDVPESFLGVILDPPPNTVVLVDAVEMGAEGGTVAIVEVGELASREASTHRPPLDLLARVIQEEVGADVFVLGIQPNQQQVGAPASPEVVEAAGHLAVLLRDAASLSNYLREEATVC